MYNSLLFNIIIYLIHIFLLLFLLNKNFDIYIYIKFDDFFNYCKKMKYLINSIFINNYYLINININLK